MKFEDRYPHRVPEELKTMTPADAKVALVEWAKKCDEQAEFDTKNHNPAMARHHQEKAAFYRSLQCESHEQEEKITKFGTG